MARRRHTNPAFSLFAFQDIITSVTGIMILITLFLAIELISRVEGASAPEVAEEYQNAQVVVKELKAEIEELKNRMAEAARELEQLPSLDEGEVERRTRNLEQDSERLQQDVSKANEHYTSRKQELDDKEEKAGKEKTANESRQQELIEEINNIKARLKRLQSGDRIIYTRGATGKRTWLVEVTGKMYQLAPIGEDYRPKRFDRIVGLAKWAGKLDRLTNAFLLVVKPDGRSRYVECKKLLGDAPVGMGFDVGIHLIGQKQQVLAPDVGAGGL